MKKILITSLVTLALVGCGSKDASDSEKAESTITPPSSQQAAQSASTQAASKTSEMYKMIHQSLYLLKEAQDPNLNEILDKIDLYSADNSLDQREAQEILDMIKLHASALSAKNQAQPAGQATPHQAETPNGSKEENPNPFQAE